MNNCSETLELTTFINSLSVAAANCLDDDELALAAAVLTQIGDVLAVIAVQRSICNKKNK